MAQELNRNQKREPSEPFFPGTESQKHPRVRKIRVRNSGGRKWLRQFYGCLEFLRSFCRKDLHVHKIPRFGGSIWVWGGGGGRSANFIFMGARIFLRKRNWNRRRRFSKTETGAAPFPSTVLQHTEKLVPEEP